MPGTGGTFLTNFINAAKLNLSKKFKFSENYGHSHQTKLWQRIWIGDHFVEEDSLSLIHQILNLEKQTDNLTNTPYFSAAHISDKQLVQQYFQKNIRIVYEHSDLVEIALSYIGKYEIEIANIEITEFTYNRILKRVSKFLVDFIKVEENNIDTCYISWKELTKQDPNELIEKLHSFTSIPKENFFIENLLEWRSKTFIGIEKTKELLYTKYNTGDILC
jgi:hypothetical protein